MQGAASNAGVETVQSLLRITGGDGGFLARAWLAPLLLWHGGKDAVVGAVELATRIIGGFPQRRWDGPQPRSDEEVVDAWTCAAQVLVFDADAASRQPE